MGYGLNNMPKSTITVNPAYPTHYGNVILTAGNGTTCVSGAGTVYNWATTADTSWYTKQPRVQITNSDIELDGMSLRQVLLDLQERMAIMIPNPALEREFDELRACADRYRKLERKFLEQKQIWETLK
jgi:hypothetical protein